jgi:hypothetical protein
VKRFAKKKNKFGRVGAHITRKNHYLVNGQRKGWGFCLFFYLFLTCKLASFAAEWGCFQGVRVSLSGAFLCVRECFCLYTRERRNKMRTHGWKPFYSERIEKHSTLHTLSGRGFSLDRYLLCVWCVMSLACLLLLMSMLSIRWCRKVKERRKRCSSFDKLFRNVCQLAKFLYS